MELEEITVEHMSANDLDLCLEKGNTAIRCGDETESLKWYIKGLSKARELKNAELERLFSNLIITMI